MNLLAYVGVVYLYIVAVLRNDKLKLVIALHAPSSLSLFLSLSVSVSVCLSLSLYLCLSTPALSRECVHLMAGHTHTHTVLCLYKCTLFRKKALEGENNTIHLCCVLNIAAVHKILPPSQPFLSPHIPI